MPEPLLERAPTGIIMVNQLVEEVRRGERRERLPVHIDDGGRVRLDARYLRGAREIPIRASVAEASMDGERESCDCPKPLHRE